MNSSNRNSNIIEHAELVNESNAELKFTRANGLKLAYEEFGDAKHPAVILISGVATQLTAWPVNLCMQLAELGYRVIRFDNRDIGLSEKLHYKKTPNPFVYMWKKQMMLPRRAPYTLRDMSKDVVGLMDALNIPAAHLVGASMGGMIAQLVASHSPSRTLTLTSIMSTSGAPMLPGPKPKMLLHLLAPRPKDERGILTRAVKTLRLASGGTKFIQSDEEMYKRVKESFHRSHYPAGASRHMIAITATGSRVRDLRKINAPSLIIHGANDPMIPPAAAYSTARHISNSSLAIIDQMGHDLPPTITPTLIGLLEPHLNGGNHSPRDSQTLH